MPLPETFEEVVKRLGHVIPCYRDGEVYCHGDDDMDCNDGCQFFRCFKAGYEAAKAEINS